MKKLIEQIFKFGVVGVICTVLDYGIMIILKEFLGAHYLLASGMGFSISVVVNYVLSMKYVFEGKKDTDKKKEFVNYVVLSVIGLGLDQLTMGLLVEILGIWYIIAKAFSTGIAMIYNFISRKLLIEKKVRG